jgi:hypothetical protein
MIAAAVATAKSFRRLVMIASLVTAVTGRVAHRMRCILPFGASTNGQHRRGRRRFRPGRRERLVPATRHRVSARHGAFVTWQPLMIFDREHDGQRMPRPHRSVRVRPE